MTISIVTPSFGQLEWLRLCTASVADQEGVNVEHIVQDGGTAGISEAQFPAACGRRDYRLLLYAEKDAGMYDAINRGLRRATGDIRAYLNCDEQYLPGALARVATFFAAHPEIEVLFGDFVLTNVEGDPISYRRIVLPRLSHLRLAPLGIGSCATFFRRTLLERDFYFDPKWKTSGDAVWMENLLMANVRMAALPEPLAIFTLTGKNLGQGAGSRGEGLRRTATSARFIRPRRASALMAYRLRKVLAGAYRRRHVEIEIYTQASPEKRQRIMGDQVGFSWPA